VNPLVSFESFLKEALEPTKHMRRGQRFMNVLSVHRPDLEHHFLGSGSQSAIDPFYCDELLWATVEYVRRNW